jgi:hypothetical protein
MKKNSAYVKAVTTPSQAKIGCGISAEFLPSSINIAKKLINSGKYKSFHTILVKKST